MQIFILCFVVTAVICLIQGIRKSSFGFTRVPKQHCVVCGWTKEKVQLCQIEQHHKTIVALLCFDCSIEHDAQPVRDRSVGTAYSAYV